MGWSVAPALLKLRAEIDALWPSRDRSADGTIGDSAHQRGKSEHNPDAHGVVRAMDITERGVDIQRIINACIGDPRVHYIIYHGRICSRTTGWQWRPSSGHEHHMHVSLRNNTSGRDSWDIINRAANDTSTWLHKSGATSSPQEDDLPYASKDLQLISESAIQAQLVQTGRAPKASDLADMIVERLLDRKLGLSGPAVKVALQDSHGMAMEHGRRLDQIEQRLAALEGRA